MNERKRPAGRPANQVVYKQEDWPVVERSLAVIIEEVAQKRTPSAKRRFLELKQKGYSAIRLDADLMSLLLDGKITDTLSNLLQYSRPAEKQGSTFVFQSGSTTSSIAPVLSKTRLVINNFVVFVYSLFCVMSMTTYA
jgi:hypothetical protein